MFRNLQFLLKFHFESAKQQLFSLSLRKVQSIPEYVTLYQNKFEEVLIRFENVSKQFPNGGVAVENLTFEVLEGELLVFLGPSGSGKTTAMRLINRLIEPTSGKIYVNDQDISHIDPIQLRRNIGYVIQHIGLFPHMTVGENIGIVPKLLKWPKGKRRARIEELLTMVGLDPGEYCERYPGQLSGGQKQRVGVARALAADPSIILMDEPFGALDPISREQMQHEFLELKTSINKTIIFVTHDVMEAVKMGDRIALLDEGKLIQIASPEELIDNADCEFVEHFLGKQRFELSLLTTSLGAVVSKFKLSMTPQNQTGQKILLSQSLLEALNLFKQENVRTLPLFDGDNYLGHFEKTQLIESISHLL